MLPEGACMSRIAESVGAISLILSTEKSVSFFISLLYQRRGRYRIIPIGGSMCSPGARRISQRTTAKDRCNIAATISFGFPSCCDFNDFVHSEIRKKLI